MSNSRLLVTQITNEPKCYMKERAALNTPCMGTYPKQCCHFGALIASYGDEDDDDDYDDDDDDDDDADHDDDDDNDD